MAEKSDDKSKAQTNPATPPAAAPASPSPAAPKPEETYANPLDAKKPEGAGSSDLIKSIVSTETGAEGKLLEAAPDIDRSLLQDLTPEKSVLLVVLKTVFAVLLLISFASILFFTSQLTDKLGFASDTFGIPNVSKQLAATNTEIVKLQTDLNLYRYIQVKSYLDEFSFFGDAFIQNYEISESQTISGDEKADAKSKMDELRNSIREIFLTARDKYNQPITASLIDKEMTDPIQINAMFEQELTSKLVSKANEVVNQDNPSAQRESKTYRQTTNLIGNAILKKLMVDTDFDTLTDAELAGLITSVNNVIINDLSIVQEIKNQRIRWSDIINEIALRTSEVDKQFASDLYEQIGGITYSSYDFNTDTRRISVIGESKRFDTTNFTLITNLIDSLNSSDFFEGAGMKSFSKSGSFEEGFVASLKIDFVLKEKAIVLQDKSNN